MVRHSFISTYQEKSNQQAKQALPKALAATHTRTDSRESTDQDVRNLGTGTETATRENRDSDSSGFASFFAIPFV